MNEEITTIQLKSQQYKNISMDKIKYKLPFTEIIEAYQRLIENYNLRNELDIVVEEMKRERGSK